MAGFAPRIDHAAARIDHRPLRRRHHRDRFLDPLQVTLDLRLVAHARRGLRRRIGSACELDVLRDIDDDRPRTARCRDVEGFVDRRGELVDVLHQPVVLGAGPRDADGIAFLERVGADQRGRNLPGDAHDRDRIHQRVLQRRHRVRRAGPRGHQEHTRLASRASVALGRVAGALLVAHQDVLDVFLLEKLVIDRKHGAARIAENMLDAVVLERPDHDLGAGHLVLAVIVVLVVHCPGPVLLPSRRRFPGRLSLLRAIKKAPEGACCRA